jgi:hypothetical protein
MAASTISGAQNLLSKRSQILATPHVGSELNEDLIVFAYLPESGPSQRISKSISSDGVTFSSDIMPLEIDL